MTLKQILVVTGAVVLTAVIYIFGDLTKPPKEDSDTPEPSQASANESSQQFSLEQFIKKRKAGIADSLRQIINTQEKNLENARSDNNKLRALEKLDSVSRSYGLRGISTYYSWRASQIEPTQQRLLRAGKNFSQLAGSVNDSSQRNQFKQMAVQSLRAATQQDSSAIAPRIALANVYLQDREKVMKGINILLNIVDERPNHPRANLILGRYGIISGQYDKAISRLRNVIKSDTLKARGHFHLGEAYFGSGNKEKALEHFKISKEFMNDPALKDTLNTYIQNIENI